MAKKQVVKIKKMDKEKKSITDYKFAVGVVCLVLALVLGSGVLPLIRHQVVGEEKAYFVNVDIINSNSIITENDIIEKFIYKSSLINYVKNKEDIVGKYATTDMYMNDAIVSSKLSNSPVFINEYELEDGELLLSISLKSVGAGIANKIEKNDIVRVLFSYPNSTEENLSAVSFDELQYVEVFSTTIAKNETVENIETTSLIVTLKVSIEQAELLAGLENKGIITLALVHRGDAEKSKELLAKQKEVITNKHGQETQYFTPQQDEEETEG